MKLNDAEDNANTQLSCSGLLQVIMDNRIVLSGSNLNKEMKHNDNNSHNEMKIPQKIPLPFTLRHMMAKKINVCSNHMEKSVHKMHRFVQMSLSPSAI